MPAQITVRELLEFKRGEIHWIGPDATVFEAIKTMSEAKIGALPVIEAGALVGIFSERDYARRIILEGKASKETPVREVMTASVTSISPEQTVKQCMAMMTKSHFRHLPVIEGGSVVGIISIGDIVRAILMSIL